MLDLPYSLVIEATDEPDFFGFYSPDLEGFTGSRPLGRGLSLPGPLGHEGAPRTRSPKGTFRSRPPSAKTRRCCIRNVRHAAGRLTIGRRPSDPTPGGSA